MPLTIEPKPHALLTASAFVLTLSGDQLFALEKVRSGGRIGHLSHRPRHLEATN
jgi:hypothetical protein